MLVLAEVVEFTALADQASQFRCLRVRRQAFVEPVRARGIGLISRLVCFSINSSSARAS